MSSRGSAPIPIRVQRALGDMASDVAHVSAVVLETAVSDGAAPDRRDLVNRIAQELWRRFGDGELVLWHDGEGTPLREPPTGISGSKAVREPLVFGMPGASPPAVGLRGLSYEEHLAAARARGNDNDRPDGAGEGDTVSPGEVEATEHGVGPALAESHDKTPPPAAEVLEGGEEGVPLLDEALEEAARRIAAFVGVDDDPDLDFAKQLAEVLGSDRPSDEHWLVQARVRELIDTADWHKTAYVVTGPAAIDAIRTGIASPPDWFPEHLTAAYLELPAVHDELRLARDRDRKARSVLRYCGFPNAGAPKPEAQRAIAKHAAEQPALWRAVANGAVRAYSDAALLEAERALQRTPDPLQCYVDAVDQQGLEPPLLALAALLTIIRQDEDAAAEIVEDASKRTHVEPGEQAGRNGDRIADFEARLEGARQRARERGRQLREANERERGLSRQITQLTRERDGACAERDRAKQALVEARVGAASSAQEVARASALEEQVVKLEGDLRAARGRAEELEEGAGQEATELQEQREYAEDLQEQLADARATLEAARAERAEAERVRDELTETRDRLVAREAQLLDELTVAHTLVGEVPSPEDPHGLATVLGRAVGPAVREAGARLAAGRSRAGDDAVLELAGRVAAFGESLGPGVRGEEAAEDAGALTEAPEETPEPALDYAADAEAGDEAAPDAVAEGSEATNVETTERQLVSAHTTPRPASRSPAPLTRDWLVRPIGGGQEVGGSAVLVTAPSGSVVLLDCGQRIKPGRDNPASVFHYGIPFIPRLDGICITHAHADHIGSLPRLHSTHSTKQPEPIPVLMSAPTRELARLGFADARNVQRQVYGEEIASKEMADAALEASVCPPPGERIELADGLWAELIPDVWHVLGSCAIRLHDERADTTLVYTGDLGPASEQQLTMPERTHFERLVDADVLISECTNGDQPDGLSPDMHPAGKTPRQDAVARLLRATRATLADREGSLLVPVSAIGPAQELLALFRQAMTDGDVPQVPIYVSGYAEHVTTCYDDARRTAVDGGERWVSDARYGRVLTLSTRQPQGSPFSDQALGAEISDILDEGPSIILAGPTSLAAGWSQAAALRMLGEARHGLLLTDHDRRRGMPKRGRRWPALSSGAGVDVNAQIYTHQIDGHATGADLRQFLRMADQSGRVRALGLVHGFPEQQDALRRHAQQSGFDLTIEPLANDTGWQAPGDEGLHG